ncbi:MAG: recombination mediator RecR [Prevotellaceae bacterium]|jgi:recombination protein RecR|nr:recombination mediator RecR [Prevotellaceae bacterium]
MSENKISSTLLSDAVDQMSRLPGIGRKTALRLTLFLLKQSKEEVRQFGQAFINMREELNYCEICNNISDLRTCPICSDPTRNHSLICVVENILDVMSIENTRQYDGLYHVLGGVISPIDGVGPGDLKINSLLDRVQTSRVSEVIMALSTTMEGETTSFYLFRKLAPFDLRISVIARGINFGDELQYTDEVTLGRSIKNRQPFNPE